MTLRTRWAARKGTWKTWLVTFLGMLFLLVAANVGGALMGWNG